MELANMTEIIIGSEVEGKIKILDLRDIWTEKEDVLRPVHEVSEFIEFKGCKMVEIGWHDEFSKETFDRLTEVSELSEKNDIYDIAHFTKEDWKIYVAVPRDYIVILGKHMYKVSPKRLESSKELAVSYVKARDIGKVIKQGKFSNEDGKKGTFTLCENGFNAECGDEWYRRATVDRIGYFALHEDGAICINAHYSDERYFVDDPESWIEAIKKVFTAKGIKLTKMGYIVVK